MIDFILNWFWYFPQYLALKAYNMHLRGKINAIQDRIKKMDELP